MLAPGRKPGGRSYQMLAPGREPGGLNIQLVFEIKTLNEFNLNSVQ